ncbi:MAG: polysaccharide biosynthesis/export family protein [Methylococcaceae bacterium]
MNFFLNKIKFLSLFLLFSLYLSACSIEKSTTIKQVTSPEVVYTLGSGDLIKILIFNQENMSGEYQVNGNGMISIPLVGSIKVQGLTLLEVEQTLKDKLQPDYLLNPRLSIQVMNFRPFYILGEVAIPRSYPYVDGMTYLNAVAIAGGYTYRAKKDYVFVVRGDDTERNEVKLSTDQRVMPGDTIRVDERFF